MNDEPPRPGRPRDAQKGLAILDAAWALFLARGIEGTSIEAIAARASVSKVTLYSHYKDKTALFRAAILREMERIEQAQRPPDGPAPPIADALRQFGLGILGFLISPPAIDFYSVIAGELRRHHDLAQAFYDLGPGRTRANLSALIASAVASGELRPCDVDQAAEELFGLWQGFSNFQLALDIGIPAIEADLPFRIERGVTLFLRLYRP